MEESLTKADLTRKKILDTSLKLFEEMGFQNTTMRLIAKEAECSIGLTYRYFQTKEELVLALYEKILIQLENKLSEIPQGNLSVRFEFIMKAKLDLIANHRKTLGALFSTSLDPEHPLGVFNENTKSIREKGIAIFTEVVTGASDFQNNKLIQEKIAKGLYLGHLGLILLWFLDKTRDYKVTYEALSLVKDVLAMLNPLLSSPFAGMVIERFDRIIEPLLKNEKDI